MKAPALQDVPGESIPDFEIIPARRAHFILANGQLDTSLWYGMGGGEHADP
jgi:hypothetical protein